MIKNDPRIIELRERMNDLQVRIKEYHEEIMKIQDEINKIAESYALFKIGDKFFNQSHKLWLTISSISYTAINGISYHGRISKARRGKIPSLEEGYTWIATEEEIVRDIKNKRLLPYKEGEDTSSLFLATRKKVVNVYRLKVTEKGTSIFFLGFKKGDGVIVEISGYSSELLKTLEKATSLTLVNGTTCRPTTYRIVATIPSEYRNGKFRFEIAAIIRYVTLENRDTDLLIEAL